MRAAKGFTLIEMIMVIVITGVISSVVAVFMKKPVEGYFDSARRAELTDSADLALRRMTRDLRLALSNSVRVSSSGYLLEYVPTLAGGRYAEAPAEPCFISGCSSLLSLGSVQSASNQYTGKGLVIFNTYNNAAGGCAAATLPSVYCGNNRVAISASSTSGGQDTFTFDASSRFYPPGGSPNRRFQIVDDPVSYACDIVTGTLTRHWGYGWQATQPASFASGQSALLTSHVSGCQFRFQTGVQQRSALATLHLSLSSEGESVSLYQTIQVNNVP